MEVAVLTFGGSRFPVVAAATANARSEVLFVSFDELELTRMVLCMVMFVS